MALSKPFNFITQPPKDFNCPICLSILEDPFLTTCCGAHFCEACVRKVKRQHNECPLCRESPLNAVIDKYFKRQLDQLMVYCPQKECDWTGELGKVNEHLATGQPAGDCQYVTLECTLSCGQKILRKSLKSHVTNHCPYRIVACEYCDFRGSHMVVTTEHKDTCLNYPCTCPNFCSLNIIRRHQLLDHLAKCPEQEIPCSFIDMGCTKIMRRRQLQEHIGTSIIEHQMLTCKAFQAMQLQHQLEMAAIRDELARVESKAEQTEYWVNGFKIMAEEVKKNNWTVYLSRMSELVTSMSPAVTPVIISVPNNTVSHHSTIHSAPFYTHPHGYKMLLYFYGAQSSVYMASKFEGYTRTQNIDTVVSLCVVQGEYDESLTWPLQGKATILLLNSQQDDKHKEATCNFIATRYADDEPACPEATSYADHELGRSNFSTVRHSPHKKRTQHASFSCWFTKKVLKPSCDSHHHQCKPVECADTMKFSFDNFNHNDNDGNYFKGNQIFFKVTIETN